VAQTFTQLQQQPALIPAFIEETLRYYSPFSATIRRASRDAMIAGTTIPEGSLVLPLIASANRDDSVFERADEFVIDRAENPHIALGFGIHNCLGAHLARIEGQIAVASLTAALTSMTYADGEAVVPGELGGPSSLRVKIETK